MAEVQKTPEQVDAQKTGPQNPGDLATQAEKQNVKARFEKGLESNSFDKVNSLLNEQTHIEGMSKFGSVSINKNPNGSISVYVSSFENRELKTTIFAISPEGNVQGEAQIPARSKASHEGGGTTKDQYNLHPTFSLDDILGSFKRKTEKSE